MMKELTKEEQKNAKFDNFTYHKESDIMKI